MGAAGPGSPDPSRVRLLAITDEVDERIYNESLALRAGSVDLVLSCGDLPNSYLDFVGSALKVPVLGVHGNHDSMGEEDLPSIHGRVVEESGLLIAGFDGSVFYNGGPYQYTQAAMRFAVSRIVPRLLWERLVRRRRLDVLLTHSAAKGVDDRSDPPHAGFDAFRWLIETFQPRYHIHGHVHLYNRNETRETRVGRTTVLNVFPYRWLEILTATGLDAETTIDGGGQGSTDSRQPLSFTSVMSGA